MSKKKPRSGELLREFRRKEDKFRKKIDGRYELGKEILALLLKIQELRPDLSWLPEKIAFYKGESWLREGYQPKKRRIVLRMPTSDSWPERKSIRTVSGGLPSLGKRK